MVCSFLLSNSVGCLIREIFHGGIWTPLFYLLHYNGLVCLLLWNEDHESDDSFTSDVVSSPIPVYLFSLTTRTDDDHRTTPYHSYNDPYCSTSDLSLVSTDDIDLSFVWSWPLTFCDEEWRRWNTKNLHGG